MIFLTAKDVKQKKAQIARGTDSTNKGIIFPNPLFRRGWSG